MDQKALYTFGRFRVDPLQELLLRDGEPVALPPKAFETLRVLVERRGTIVSKKDLLEAVWPGVFVEENNLSQCISHLRKALGDDRRDPVYIQTVARRGYRFRAAEQRPRDRTNARPVWRLLRGSRAVALLAVCVGIVAALALSRVAARTPLVGRSASTVSVIVLPYQVADGSSSDGTDPAYSYVGMALADDLDRQLGGRSTRLKLSPVSAVYPYLAGGAEQRAEPVQAARKQGADFALTARMEANGDRAVLRAALVRAADGATVWTESIRGDSRTPFALQDRLVTALQSALLGDRAGDNSSRLTPRTHITEDLRAYAAYVHGRRLWNLRTSEGIYQSIDLEEQATAEDPKFALAYAALADAYACDMTGWHKADAAARKALALNPQLGEAHASLGLLQMLWHGDYEAAAEEFRTAIRLNPEYAGVHEWYADNFATQGRMIEAFQEMRTALEMDPTSLPVNTDMARLLYLDHQFDQAREQSRHALELDPRFLGAHVVLHDTLLALHEDDAAMAEFGKMQELQGSSGLYAAREAGSVREAYAKQGIQGFYRARIGFFTTSFHDDYQKARYLALLGRKQDALKSLQQAVEEAGPHKLFVLYAKVDPAFDGLRNDEHFKKTVGLD